MSTEQEEDESYVSARHTNTFLCWHEEEVQDSDVTEGVRERERERVGGGREGGRVCDTVNKACSQYSCGIPATIAWQS